MDWSLRELRCFVTAVDTGSFTDAASKLFISQASVSRTIASLEKQVGEALLRRIPRGCEPTATGAQLLPHARRLLAEADRFTEFVRNRRDVLRLGYAWAALGKHTPRLVRDWESAHPDRELRLVRHNSPSGGLSEGVCDVAIIRNPLDDARFDSVIVGLERRLVAFPANDAAWARRRQLSMAEVAERPILMDPRTGTTNIQLWAGIEHQPEFIESFDVDDWLTTIAAGHGIGTTAEATAHHHARPGVVFRPIKDSPRIPVRLAWWQENPPGGLAELVDAVTKLYASDGG